jgi:hypothetical protein
MSRGDGWLTQEEATSRWPLGIQKLGRQTNQLMSVDLQTAPGIHVGLVMDPEK